MTRRRQQRLAAPGRDLEAEGGKLLTESVAAGEVGPPACGFRPGPLDPVEPPVRVLASRRRVLLLPRREFLKEAADRRQSPLLVLLEDHRSSLSIAS